MKISRAKIALKTVKLTADQEQRLSKLYSMLDLINPTQSAQNQQESENDKTVILAESNPN